MHIHVPILVFLWGEAVGLTHGMRDICTPSAVTLVQCDTSHSPRRQCVMSSPAKCVVGG